MKRAFLRVRLVKNRAKYHMEGWTPTGPLDPVMHEANNILLIFLSQKPVTLSHLFILSLYDELGVCH